MIQKICGKIIKTIKDNLFLAVIIAVVAVGIAGLSVYALRIGNIDSSQTLTAQLAGKKAVDYINKNFIGPDESQAELIEAADFSGLFKVTFSLDYGGTNVNEIIYVTKDGKYLFPEMPGIPMKLDEPPLNQEQSGATSDFSSESTAVSSEELVKFVACLEKAEFVIYGANWCGWTKGLVEMLGGWETVKPIYVECTEEQELCLQKGIQGYPTIIVNDREYQGERTFNAFGAAASCETPIGVESVNQGVPDGGC